MYYDEDIPVVDRCLEIPFHIPALVVVVVCIP